MFVKLPESGKNVVVTVKHNLFDDEYRKNTMVTLLIEGEFQQYAALAVCHPRDNFCKRAGRKQAAIRLLQMLPFGKTDKHVVFKAICPEYFSK